MAFEILVWTDEKVKQVEELAERGITSLEIAERLGCTRGAVMGICKRRGIALKSRLKDLKTICSIHSAKKKAPPKGRAPNAKTEPPREVQGSVPCSLAEMRRNKCYFPLWDGDTPAKERRYCGAWTAEYPYCEDHRSVVFKPRK